MHIWKQIKHYLQLHAQIVSLQDHQICYWQCWLLDWKAVDSLPLHGLLPVSSLDMRYKCSTVMIHMCI